MKISKSKRINRKKNLMNRKIEKGKRKRKKIEKMKKTKMKI